MKYKIHPPFRFRKDGKYGRDGKYGSLIKRKEIILRQSKNKNCPWIMPKALFVPFFFLGTTTIGNAALQYPLDDLKVIEVAVSRQGLTRIAVKEDRILNVFGVAGEYVLEADETQGQVFIRPVGPGVFKPISLTLTTEEGHTQDLRLIPQDQPPEALILNSRTSIKPEQRQELTVGKEIKVEISKEKPCPQTINPKGSQPFLTNDHMALKTFSQNGRTEHNFIHDHHMRQDITRDEIETLLQACQDGCIPPGYKAMPLNLKTLHQPYLLVRELKGEKLRGLTYDVKNTTKAPLIFSELEFIKTLTSKKIDLSASRKGEAKVEIKSKELTRVVAVLMNQKTLNPGERMDVYVVTATSY